MDFIYKAKQSLMECPKEGEAEAEESKLAKQRSDDKKSERTSTTTTKHGRDVWCFIYIPL